MDMVKWQELPVWTDDPLDRLRHTVAVYAALPDDEWAVRATGNFVPG